MLPYVEICFVSIMLVLLIVLMIKAQEPLNKQKKTADKIEKRGSQLTLELEDPSIPKQTPWDFSSSSRLRVHVLETGGDLHTQHRGESEWEIRRKASYLTVEEAWRGARDAFWEVRRESLQMFLPHIYKEIMYWENRPDQYVQYMGFKYLFNIPYVEHDFWVRKPKSKYPF